MDILEFHLELPPDLEVERRQRLVEQEHARAVHDRARQGDPLRLAAGQRLDLAPLEPGEPNELERLGHLLARLRLRHVRDPQSETHSNEHA